MDFEKYYNHLTSPISLPTLIGLGCGSANVKSKMTADEEESHAEKYSEKNLCIIATALLELVKTLKETNEILKKNEL